MTRSASISFLAILLCGALAGAGCGDDDNHADSPQAGNGGARDAGPGGRDAAQGAPGNGTMTAVVDGMDWEAVPDRIRARTDEDIPGGYEIQGTSPGATSQISLWLYYVDGPGTYPFGVTASVVGASASYAELGAIWQAPGSGDAGTLTITQLDEDRIAGTFEFDVVPVPGSSATGMHAITEGSFDLPLEGSVRPITADVGSTLSAQFDGELFNAASVVLTPVAGGLGFNAINDAYNVGFVLMGVDAPGSYALTMQPLARSVAVVAGAQADQDTHCCWVTTPEDNGSLTLTTLSDDRLVGTFEFTLPAMQGSQASAPLVVTRGVFDLGRAEP